MQPNDTILFSKRACWVNSAVIVAVSLPLALLYMGNAPIASLGVALLCVSLVTGLVGVAFGWFCNRVVITRLKLRYPDKAQEIEDYRYGRAGWDVRYSLIIREEDLYPFIAEDPQREQMLSERRTLEIFGLVWRWSWVLPVLIAFGVAARTGGSL